MLRAVVTDVTYVLKLEDVMTCNQPVLPVIYSKKSHSERGWGKMEWGHQVLGKIPNDIFYGVHFSS